MIIIGTLSAVQLKFQNTFIYGYKNLLLLSLFNVDMIKAKALRSHCSALQVSSCVLRAKFSVRKISASVSFLIIFFAKIIKAKSEKFFSARRAECLMGLEAI